MLVVDLEDGRRFAVRPSGTEPKIKFYMFAKHEPYADRPFANDELAEMTVPSSKWSSA